MMVNFNDISSLIIVSLFIILCSSFIGDDDDAIIGGAQAFSPWYQNQKNKEINALAPLYSSCSGPHSQFTDHDNDGKKNQKEIPIIPRGVTVKMAFDKSYAVADNAPEKSERFTSPPSLDLVHRLRRCSHAVLVGRSTVERDDCTLTVRRVPMLTEKQNQPVRVVLDPSLKIFQQSEEGNTGADDRFQYALLKDGLQTIVYHCCEDVDGIFQNEFEENDNIVLVRMNQNENTLSPKEVLHDLHKRGIHHVMVEGGPLTALAFLKERCVDRAIMIRAPVTFIDPVGSGMSDELLREAGLILLGTRRSSTGDEDDDEGDIVEYWIRKGEEWPTEELMDWP